MVQGQILLPDPFSLGLTLLCGQCFRWKDPDAQGWFQGAAGGAWWRLRQEGRTLAWECSEHRVRGMEPELWLAHYLGAKDDLSGPAAFFQEHPVLQEPWRELRGLRLMRQEPWECAVSYMFAQGLSVAVIQRAIERFCGRFGEPLADHPSQRDFPRPEALAGLSPDDLRPFTNNYRARAQRIIQMARVVEAQVLSLEHLAKVPCDDARETLSRLEGIGPKIADCILLFSLGQESAFPVDRWVLRAMKRYFPSVRLGARLEAPTLTQYTRIVRKARKVFDPYSGLASEYLFLYLRLKEEPPLARKLAPFLNSLP